MSEQHPYQGVRVYGLGFKPYNIRTRGYRVTCLSTVLSICSSALRAVRWMSPLSAPIATLKTARMACVSGNQSSFRGHKQRAHLHAALDCLAVGAYRRSEDHTHNELHCRTVDVFAESDCKVNRHLHEAVAMSAKVLRGGDRQQCPNDRQLHVRIRVLAAPGHDAYHLQGSSAELVKCFNGINRDAV